MNLAKKRESLLAVEKASENYMNIKSQLDIRRDLLIDACKTASSNGATHRDISMRTPYTRQRISQFLLEGESHVVKKSLG